MIQGGAFLEVADNSGVKLVKCCKVLGGSRRKVARYGDVVVVSIRQNTPKASSSVKKGEVFLAVVVREKAPYRRKDGSVVSFNENAVVLLDKQRKTVGTRIGGIVPRELRKDFLGITTLVREVI